jgi:pimeloyl-ACP methyl ester carboxylesterase
MFLAQQQSPSIGFQSVQLSHGRTRYLEAGSGPPLLLLHGAGFLAGGDSWLLNAAALGLHFHVLAPDCLGWGPGDQLDQPYSFAYLVDFVREFQDALGLGSSHVVGHSMGGWLASVLAYESPERVDRLVLVASGGLSTRPLKSMTGFQPPTDSEVTEFFRRYAPATDDWPGLAEERMAMARDAERVRRFQGVMAHMSNPETRLRYNTARRLPLVSTPALVLWGSDDEVNPVELAHESAGLLPHSQLFIIEGARHALPTEQAETLSEQVTSFLLASA